MKINSTATSQPSSRAFTIVEVSVVVVIIAVIMAGILLGTDLMHNARVVKTLSQVDGLNKAVAAFRDKYHELPGDMPNAISFWGAESVCNATPFTRNPHKETCNGSGNSHVGDILTDAGATTYEIFRAWQHLANSGMVEGAYSGTRGSSSVSHAMPRVNIHEGPIEGSGYTFYYLYSPAGDASHWPAKYGHVILFGKENPGTLNNGAVLTPQESFSLDTKIDDGHPARGTVRTFRSGTSANCTLNDIASTTAYRFAISSPACSLLFITGF